MLNGVGVKNFRSFSNYVELKIKPITVFVGRNSSGKSSLLRTFPLFRQSAEEQTTGPILWFGRFVDFGDFSNAVSKQSADHEIEFTFDITIDKQRLRQNHFYYYRAIASDANVKVTLKVVSGKDKKTRTKEVIINLEDIKYSIKIEDGDNASISVIYKGQETNFNENLVAKKMGNFIPEIVQKRKDEQSSSQLTYNDKYIYHYNSSHEMHLSFYQLLLNLTNEIKPFFHHRTTKEKINDGLSRVGILGKKEMSQVFRQLFKDQKIFMEKFICNEDEIMDIIYPLMMLYLAPSLITAINSSLNEAYLSVKYIAPLRAASERYYRFQDLQINEIDHTGSNLAMLLNSLKVNERSRFESWTKDNFGFYVRATQVGAHFAVNVTIISDDIENTFNISDMGFGYSQVIPIITAIWIEIENNQSRRKKPIYFIIEQPELHLHPAYQHNLAVVFAKVIAKSKESGIPLNIIFETHSQNMIEALGECVNNKDLKICSDDISILIFDKNKENTTSVTKSYFDNDGYLNDWPIGFFSGVDFE